MKSFFMLTAIFALCITGFAQNANTNASRTGSKQTQKKTPAASNTSAQDEAAPTPSPEPTSTRSGRRVTTRAQGSAAANAAASKAVRDAFDALIDGIRRADVDTVMGVYWNSPQLLLFNNNGTVTRGWEQVRANRASSYPNLKDVQLDVRDVRVSMLGSDGALVTCLWSQTQTVNGATDSATGRLSLVFQRVGGAWKAVHTHTSPDRPDPSRLLPSERTAPETGTPVRESTPVRPPVKP